MLGRRPSLLTALSAGALSITVLAGCNASSSGSGGDDEASGESGPGLILITPEPVGVNPFLQLAVDGVNQAADDAGGEARVFESQDPTNIQQQMDAAIADGPDVLAVVGFEFADSVAAAAAANPEQQFLFVDACTTEEFDNVTCAVFREHEGVYLAGVEAGLLSQSGKVGAVVALDTPQIRRFSDPFGAGAQSVNPAIGFTPLYVGGNSPFNDPARAKEQALALVAQGADYVMAAAAAGNLGVFDAAEDGAFQAFGVDVNQCPGAAGPRRRQRHQGGRRRHRRQHRQDPRRRGRRPGVLRPRGGWRDADRPGGRRRRLRVPHRRPPRRDRRGDVGPRPDRVRRGDRG